MLSSLGFVSLHFSQSVFFSFKLSWFHVLIGLVQTLILSLETYNWRPFPQNHVVPKQRPRVLRKGQQIVNMHPGMLKLECSPYFLVVHKDIDLHKFTLSSSSFQYLLSTSYMPAVYCARQQDAVSHGANIVVEGDLELKKTKSQ